MINFDTMLKSSAKEAHRFTKLNAEKFSVLGDLIAAKSACKTPGAKTMIETLIVPLQKELQKSCTAFDTKMTAIWKKSKGEKLPPDGQKKLDNILNNSAKSIKSNRGPDAKPNTNKDHNKWIDVLGW